MSKTKQLKMTIIALMVLVVAAFAVTPVSASIEDADYVKELGPGWNLVSVDKPINSIPADSIIGVDYYGEGENPWYVYSNGAYTQRYRGDSLIRSPAVAFFAFGQSEGGQIGWEYSTNYQTSVPSRTTTIYEGWNVVSCGLEEGADNILAPVIDYASTLVNNDKLNQDLDEAFWSEAGPAFNKDMVPFNGYWFYAVDVPDEGVTLPVVYDPVIPEYLEVVSVDAINADQLDVDFEAAAGADQAGLVFWRVSDAEGEFYTYATATVEADDEGVLLDLEDSLADACASYTFVNKGDAADIDFTYAASAAITFSPVNASVDVAPGVVPTITFSKPMSNAEGTPLTNDNVEAEITFQKYDGVDTWNDVDFSATINGDRTVVTITPDAALLDYDGLYKVGTLALEDSDGREVPADSAEFTTRAETFATYDPVDEATDVLVTVNPTITFNYGITKADESEITNDNVAGLITLKETDAGGDDVIFDAEIDEDKKVITVIPTEDLSGGQLYYLAIAAVKDADGEDVDGTNIDFTTRPGTTVTFNPEDGATEVAESVNPTITYSKAITTADGQEITDTGVGGSVAVADMITFKADDAEGADVGFTATIDGNKKVITIVPDADLETERNYYYAIVAVNDSNGESVAAENATFTTTRVATTATFDPEDGATEIAIDAEATITFSRAIQSTDNEEIVNEPEVGKVDVNTLITLKKTNAEGDAVDFTATIDEDKKVITVVPDADLDNNQVYYLAFAAVNDEEEIEVAGESITFTTRPLTTVTFVPANGAEDVSIDTNPTITYTKPIKNADGSSITNANVASLISFRKSSAVGAVVGFTATIDVAKEVITITPTDDLEYGQVYFLAIAEVKDSFDLPVSYEEITFTTISNIDAAKAAIEEGAFDDVTSGENVIDDYAQVYADAEVGEGVVIVAVETTSVGGTVAANGDALLLGASNVVFTVTAVEGGANVDTNAIEVTVANHGDAAQLAVTQQPVATRVADAVTFGTQPIITIQDAAGNTVTDDTTSTITATIGSGGDGDQKLNSLSDAVSPAAAAGIVTYADLAGTLDGDGDAANVVLTFTLTGTEITVDSDAFGIAV